MSSATLRAAETSSRPKATGALINRHPFSAQVPLRKSAGTRHPLPGPRHNESNGAANQSEPGKVARQARSHDCSRAAPRSKKPTGNGRKRWIRSGKRRYARAGERKSRPSMLREHAVQESFMPPSKSLH